MNRVFLSSFSFLTETLTFSLVSETSGGPPTSYTWTKNGVNITDGGPFSIFLSLNESSPRRFMDSLYVSTLTVTGRYPGVHGYSVANRASAPLLDHFIIEGMYIYCAMALWSGAHHANTYSNLGLSPTFVMAMCLPSSLASTLKHAVKLQMGTDTGETLLAIRGTLLFLTE